MSDIAKTMAWLITFGRMCRTTMRASENPADCAARTYSWRLATRISPRMIRAYDTHPTSVIAT